MFLLGTVPFESWEVLAKTPVRVTEIHSENSPLITFRVIVRAGSINDPKGKQGMNLLAAQTLAQGGTGDLKYEEVIAKLYPWAASIVAQTDKEITTFIGKVHREHLELFYKIFSGLLLTPRFAPEDFQRNKDLALSYLQKTLRGSDDENLGKEALGVSMFANHPYGTAGSTVQGLQSVSLEDIKDYYRKTYTTGNIWVGIAGGYPRSLPDHIRKDFETLLPDAEFVPVPLPPPAKIEGLEILFIEKPARATAISMGHPLPLTRKDQDYYALLIANSYFGEHRTFNGVLMNRLRGDRGLNYGDYSYIERFLGGTQSGSRFPYLNTPLRQQYFSIWLRPVPPEKAHFAVRNALHELERLVQHGLTEKQFQETRKFLLNYSKLWAQTLDRRLGYRMDSEFYGTEYYIDRIDRELKSLTLEEVNSAIRKYLNSKNLKVAIVAQGAEKLMESMLANEPSAIQYASPVSDHILKEDKVIMRLPLGINKSKTKVLPAADLFEK